MSPFCLNYHVSLRNINVCGSRILPQKLLREFCLLRCKYPVSKTCKGKNWESCLSPSPTQFKLLSPLYFSLGLCCLARTINVQALQGLMKEASYVSDSPIASLLPALESGPSLLMCPCLAAVLHLVSFLLHLGVIPLCGSCSSRHLGWGHRSRRGLDDRPEGGGLPVCFLV